MITPEKPHRQIRGTSLIHEPGHICPSPPGPRRQGGRVRGRLPLTSSQTPSCSGSKGAPITLAGEAGSLCWTGHLSPQGQDRDFERVRESGPQRAVPRRGKLSLGRLLKPPPGSGQLTGHPLQEGPGGGAEQARVRQACHSMVTAVSQRHQSSITVAATSGRTSKAS